MKDHWGAPDQQEEATVSGTDGGKDGGNDGGGGARVAGLTRRERLRAELERDAKAAARRITAAEGVEGLTVAAVARSVGVTSPALYRYFDGRNGLILAVYDDVMAEFMQVVGGAVERQDPDDISARLHAATRAVLDWSMANPAEFNLLMGAGYPQAAAASAEDIPQAISRELGGMFGQLFTRLWREKGLAHPSDEEIDPALVPQLRTYREVVGLDVPIGVVFLMLTCWRQIYGMLCLAVYRHMSFALSDPVPLFEDMMDRLLGLLGLSRSPRLVL
ncbi:TetR/AcrR family transcriptional regulator [Streptomyces sparsogenes]|uniref:TetR/AcrR family transcriptional regulator n=1 Tax=Streptomyces sparsogenes TaxID=67365 RepID=UPI001FE02F49|nr:TetR/AcrR family transcriptional regulator [Streptomyces sparsogenes]